MVFLASVSAPFSVVVPEVFNASITMAPVEPERTVIALATVKPLPPKASVAAAVSANSSPRKSVLVKVAP